MDHDSNSQPSTVDELRADMAARREGIPDPKSGHPVDQVLAARAQEAGR